MLRAGLTHHIPTSRPPNHPTTRRHPHPAHHPTTPHHRTTAPPQRTSPPHHPQRLRTQHT
eukprot:977950-Prymnesium_polylepis.1